MKPTETGPETTIGALVIALDRWGRVLLRASEPDPNGSRPTVWALPGATSRTAEAPDECALRAFEEQTGQLLNGLTLFRVYRRSVDLPGAPDDVEHVYFDDPDLDVPNLESQEGRVLDYFLPQDIDILTLDPSHRTVLVQFLKSPSYRALFH